MFTPHRRLLRSGITILVVLAFIATISHVTWWLRNPAPELCCLRSKKIVETSTRLHSSLSPNTFQNASWGGTEAGQVCQTLFPSQTPWRSSSGAWNGLGPRILDASFYPDAHAGNASFRTWVSDIFRFYTVERLKRSLAHPPSTKSMRRLLELAQTRLQDPQAQAEPIRILVLGGSVVQGVGATANHLGLDMAGEFHKAHVEFAWPSRLEALLNEVLFPGAPHPVFEVRNLAVGSCNSEVGAMMLEYQLVDFKGRIPHIVMSSYSPNDAQDPDLDATFRVHQQNLVRAAHRLRPCEPDLPLIVLVDDLYRANLQVLANQQTGNTYKIASWYNLMAVVYSNVARPHAVANYAGEEGPSDLLLSSNFFRVHLGLGFHIGMAWTLFYCFYHFLYETCVDTAREESADVRTFQHSRDEPPTKYMGRVGDALSTRAEWMKDMEAEQELCHSSNVTSMDPVEPSLYQSAAYSTPVCTYAWMVNLQTSVFEASHVDLALQPVLIHNHGWLAAGHSFQQPRSGWYTYSANSTFSIQHTAGMRTPFVTILSMKSYGPTWIDSKLQLDVTVQRAAPSHTDNSSSMATYTIDGYHDVHTSVHFPHKFPLPDRGAQIGDVVTIDFTLIAGTTFKIAGIALCRS